MAEFVDHFPIENEKMAYTILNICEKNGLHDQVKSIYKIMGMQALHNNRLGSALSWGLKSKDAVFVASVSERYLNEYNGSGSFSSIDLIDSLGSSMLLTTKLTFLGKYREFHQMYAKAQLMEAAALLLSLLTARVAPTKFWPTLLLDAIPLLEADKVIFNTKQTYELLHCLEELNVSQKLDSNGKISTKDVVDDKFTILRLSLARNLSRALIEESSQENNVVKMCESSEDFPLRFYLSDAFSISFVFFALQNFVWERRCKFHHAFFHVREAIIKVLETN